MIRTQAELERQVLVQSADRIRARFEHNEGHGLANENAYAQPIYRRWVLAFHDLIRAHMETELCRPGRRAAHVALLRLLDPLVAAYCAVRVTLVSITSNPDVTARVLASSIGRALHQELVLSMYSDIAPALFDEVMRDLNRRHSHSTRHRFNATLGAARNSDHIDQLPRWSQVDREHLGMWCVESLRTLGLIDVQQYRQSTIHGRIKEVLAVSFTAEAERVMDRVRGIVEVNSPALSPCIEPPKDWVALDDGGWHTVEMRRQMPYAVNIRRVRNRDVLARVRAADMTKHVLPAINHLQRVRWQINRDILDSLAELATDRNLHLDEVLSGDSQDKPAKPEWLEDQAGQRLDKAALTPEQAEQFTAWKRAMAYWHTDTKLRQQRMYRFRTAMQMADMFKGYQAIYFVYQADFRGRLYAQTVGVSPQGSDMQKALLRFADGKPLATPEAVRWFKVNGANRYGKDKTAFAARVAWVDENDRAIIDMADDPTGHRGWTEADSPLQFLAWAKEYARWRRSPDTFLSYLPVGLDGSCNGLQHFSAMLRDEVGGKATNLLDADGPNDIYAQVAAVTQAKLADLKTDTLSARDIDLRALWIAHGINRTLVKRSVMTLPYGSTRYACSEFIVQDYLKHGLAKEFEPGQYQAAAHFLSHLVWDSIGEVVIAAARAMSWLQECAKQIIGKGASEICWTAPSGFPVTQVYNQRESVRIVAKLFGECRLYVHREVDAPRPVGHKNGLAPNFVHSMDAAHLTLTVNRCQELGIDSLAMIHDDYGTHAADTQRLYDAIRETFVGMYQAYDPIRDFFNSHVGLPEPPACGDFPIEAVRTSRYFFA